MDAVTGLSAILRSRRAQPGHYVAWAEDVAGAWTDTPKDRLLTLTPVTVADVARSAVASGQLPDQLALVTPTGPLDESRVTPSPYQLGEQYAIYSTNDPAIAHGARPTARFMRLLTPTGTAATPARGLPTIERLTESTGSILVLVESSPLGPNIPVVGIPFDQTRFANAPPQQPIPRRAPGIGDEVTEAPVSPLDPRTVWQRYQPWLVGTASAIVGFALGTGITRRLG